MNIIFIRGIEVDLDTELTLKQTWELVRACMWSPTHALLDLPTQGRQCLCYILAELKGMGVRAPFYDCHYEIEEHLGGYALLTSRYWEWKDSLVEKLGFNPDLANQELRRLWLEERIKEAS